MRILVVEDSALIALEVADQLQAWGHVVIGPAATVRTALDLVHTERPDAAVLDINLGDETSERVAEAPRDAGIPFLALSGNDRIHQPAVFKDAVWLAKPHKEQALRAAIAGLAAKATPGAVIAADALGRLDEGDGENTPPAPAAD